MKQILTITILLGLLTNCSDPSPKVVYDNAADTTDNNTIEDTTAITVAGLPIHFDSTKYLIHPIGQFSPEKKGSSLYLSKTKSGSGKLAIAYKSGYTVSGDLENLKFQHLDTSGFLTLTDNSIKIRSFTFLRSIFNATKKQILVYSISDNDSNKDGKLDHNDIESLYISDIDGLNFKKLSPELHELVDWHVMEIQNRIYFITSEDIDKNGKFDKSDQLRYYYVDLSKGNYPVIEYNPLED